MPHTIAENLQRLVDAKTAIGNAITTKGGTVGANDGLEDFATDIGTIPNREFDLAAVIDRSIVSLEVPSGTTSIGPSIFYGCGLLSSVILPNTIVDIGNSAFFSCASLTSIDIPSSVISIGTSAFRACTSLTSIDLPSGVTTIGNSAFSYCSALTSIDIPSSVTAIGSYTFDNCTNLTTITINKPTGSITGAPWGAPNATVVWTG